MSLSLTNNNKKWVWMASKAITLLLLVTYISLELHAVVLTSSLTRPKYKNGYIMTVLLLFTPCFTA